MRSMIQYNKSVFIKLAALVLVFTTLAAVVVLNTQGTYAADLPVLSPVIENGPFDPSSGGVSAVDSIMWDRHVDHPGYEKAYTNAPGGIQNVKGNEALVAANYPTGTSGYYNGTPKPEHMVWKENRLSFYGYGVNPYLDYCLTNQYPNVQEISFTLIPQNMVFHTFRQTGFLFNGTISASKYTGYAMVLECTNSEGMLETGEAILRLYYINNELWIPDNFSPGSVTGTRTLIATYRTGIKNYSRTPIEVVTQFDPGTRAFKVYIDGTMRTEVSASQVRGNGTGFGFFTGYYRHNCNILTVVRYDNVKVHTGSHESTPAEATVNFLLDGTTTPIAQPQQKQGYVSQKYSVTPPQSIVSNGVTYSYVGSDRSSLDSLFYRANAADNVTNLYYRAVGGNLVKTAQVGSDPIDNGTAENPVIVSAVDGNARNIVTYNIDTPYTKETNVPLGIAWPSTGDQNNMTLSGAASLPFGGNATGPNAYYQIYTLSQKDFAAGDVGSQISVGDTVVIRFALRTPTVAAGHSLQYFNHANAAAGATPTKTFPLEGKVEHVVEMALPVSAITTTATDRIFHFNSTFRFVAPQNHRIVISSISIRKGVAGTVSDLLPEGMEYIPGSASPAEPTIQTINGRQQLSWQLYLQTGNNPISFNVKVKKQGTFINQAKLELEELGGPAFSDYTYHTTSNVRVTEHYLEYGTQNTLKADTVTVLNAGEDYAVPNASYNTLTVGVAPYTYVGYNYVNPADDPDLASADANGFHTGRAPLPALEKIQSSKEINLYFKKNPKITVHYVDEYGNTLLGSKSEYVAVGGDVNLNGYHLKAITAGSDTYNYYDYRLSAPAGANPYTGTVNNPTNPIFTNVQTDQHITLYYAKQPMVVVHFVEHNNVSNVLKNNENYPVIGGTFTPPASLTDDIDLTQQIGRIYTYVSYWSLNGGPLTPGAPPTLTGLTENAYLTLYFETAYIITEKFHENKSTSPEVLDADNILNPVYGGSTYTGAPPAVLVKNNVIWDYVGYKPDNDSEQLITGYPTIDSVADDYTFVYCYEKRGANKPVTLKTARVSPDRGQTWTDYNNGTMQDPVAVFVDDLIAYTITASVPVTQGSGSVVISDLLPEGLEYQSSSPQGTTAIVDGRTRVTWTLPSPAAGQTLSVTVVVKVKKAASFVNFAQVTFPGQDTVATNNTYHEGEEKQLYTLHIRQVVLDPVAKIKTPLMGYFELRGAGNTLPVTGESGTHPTHVDFTTYQVAAGSIKTFKITDLVAQYYVFDGSRATTVNDHDSYNIASRDRTTQNGQVTVDFNTADEWWVTIYITPNSDTPTDHEGSYATNDFGAR